MPEQPGEASEKQIASDILHQRRKLCFKIAEALHKKTALHKKCERFGVAARVCTKSQSRSAYFGFLPEGGVS